MKMGENQIHTKNCWKKTKFELEADDDYVGVCAKVFLTRKNRFVFHCLLCRNSIHVSFPELVKHISQEHQKHNCNTHKTEEENVSTIHPKLTSGSRQLRSNLGCLPENEKFVLHARENGFELLDFEEDCDDFVSEEMVDHEVGDEASIDEMQLHKDVQIDANIMNDTHKREEVYSYVKYDVCSIKPKSTSRSLGTENERSVVPDKEIEEFLDLIEDCDDFDPEEIVDNEVGNKKVHIDAINANDLSDDVTNSLNAEIRFSSDENTSNEIKCERCDQKFLNRHALYFHGKTHHRKTKYKCDICGAGFNEMFNLRPHRLRHSGIKNFACPQCPQKYYTNTELKTHIRRHNGELRFVCATCGKRFFTSSSLYIHNKRHADPEQKCETCGKGFYDRSALVRHLAVHTEERNYACSYCDVKFKQRKTLNMHAKIHLNKLEHICHLCNKGYNQRPSLVYHLKTAHRFMYEASATKVAQN